MLAHKLDDKGEEIIEDVIVKYNSPEFRLDAVEGAKGYGKSSPVYLKTGAHPKGVAYKGESTKQQKTTKVTNKGTGTGTGTEKVKAGNNKADDAALKEALRQKELEESKKIPIGIRRPDLIPEEETRPKTFLEQLREKEAAKAKVEKPEAPAKTHKVAKGERISQIAQKYGVSAKELIAANKDTVRRDAKTGNYYFLAGAEIKLP